MLTGLRIKPSAITTSRSPGSRRRHTGLLRPGTAVAVFTGIVQGQAEVKEVISREASSRVCLQFPERALGGIQVGASVAINGTCLTITDVQQDTGYFDIIEETLRATNLGSELKVARPINFERSARVGDEIGGHNVAGHVHTTAQITSVQDTPENRTITFAVPQKWLKYIFSKGFIAVDGISLTVGEVSSTGFCVYLIPETLRVTNMGAKREGDSVNLEMEAQTQAIVDTTERVVGALLKRKGLDSLLEGNRAEQPQLQGLPHAYGRTAAEHGLPEPELVSPLYA